MATHSGKWKDFCCCCCRGGGGGGGGRRRERRGCRKGSGVGVESDLWECDYSATAR